MPKRTSARARRRARRLNRGVPCGHRAGSTLDERVNAGNQRTIAGSLNPPTTGLKDAVLSKATKQNLNTL